VIYTSGGTESIQSAITGIAKAAKKRGLGNHIITSKVEHDAVLDCLSALESDGFEVTYLPVNAFGQVTAESVADAVTDNTILVSLIYANNEVGSINPIQSISTAVKAIRNIPIHLDAVQAPGLLSLDVNELGVDAMSLSGHKFYGPRGSGILYLRLATAFEPMFKGRQQGHRRAGTEALPLVVGISHALSLAEAARNDTIEKLQTLTNQLKEVLKNIPEAEITGHLTDRLAGHVSLVMRGLNGDSILLDLNEVGIYASGGSACTTGQQEPSHVLSAMGIDEVALMGQMRFVLGKWTTSRDIEVLAVHLNSLVERHRHFAG
jgi:cysteine desulfurase